jgi:hypothetical protein
MPTVAHPRPAPSQRSGQRAGSTSQEPARWPLERILFLMAGTMTGLSAVLAAVVSPWFLLLTGFVAVNQLAFVAFGNCPSSLVLRLLGARSLADAGCGR